MSTVKTYTLAEAVHVEGHCQRLGERFSLDFKAGKHKPKNEAEEDALELAIEALGVAPEPEPAETEES
jgi:hypothetical protein